MIGDPEKYMTKLEAENRRLRAAQATMKRQINSAKEKGYREGIIAAFDIMIDSLYENRRKELLDE